MRGCSARFVPCTALGCIELLRRSGIMVMGKSVAIVGDSNIVGMPLAMLFRDEGAATVTVVHRTSYSGLFNQKARDAEVCYFTIDPIYRKGQKHEHVNWFITPEINKSFFIAADTRAEGRG